MQFPLFMHTSPWSSEWLLWNDMHFKTMAVTTRYREWIWTMSNLSYSSLPSWSNGRKMYCCFITFLSCPGKWRGIWNASISEPGSFLHGLENRWRQDMPVTERSQTSLKYYFHPAALQTNKCTGTTAQVNKMLLWEIKVKKCYNSMVQHVWDGG